jgi:hypothetical protein
MSQFQSQDCTVAIVGGTTAALAAALTTAQEFLLTNKTVCLFEPTDWVGGQLTASAVPAIDFAWHTLKNMSTGFVLNVGALSKSQENVSPFFWKALQTLNTSGNCWVSNYCFPPLELLEQSLWPAVQNFEAANVLKVYLNTVLTGADVRNNNITSLSFVQRVPNGPCNGYDVMLSQDLGDWYSPKPSSRFNKNILNITASFFVDASEWGELLVVSGAPFLQGIDEQFDGDTSGVGNATCGQSITYDFTQLYNLNPTPEPPNPMPVHYPEYYSLHGDTWDQAGFELFVT